MDTGNTNVGQLTACGTFINQYISISVNGKIYTMNYPVDSISYWFNGVSRFNSMPVASSAGNFVDWSTQAINGTGTFPVTGFSLNAVDETYFQYGAMQCTITQFGKKNEFIVGSLSGSVTDTLNQPIYPMTGTFRVNRGNN